MFWENFTTKSHREGYRQGMITALLISSPFIIAGVKWMMENREPVTKQMSKQMKNVTEADLYTQFFNKEKHEEKTATRKLDHIRANEGNFNVEATNDEDEQLFKMIKEITKNELANNEKSV